MKEPFWNRRSCMTRPWPFWFDGATRNCINFLGHSNLFAFHMMNYWLLNIFVLSILIKHESCVSVCVSVHVFQSHQKSQLHEILTQGVIWELTSITGRSPMFQYFIFTYSRANFRVFFNNLFFPRFLRKSEPFQTIGLWKFDKVTIFIPKNSNIEMSSHIVSSRVWVLVPSLMV